MANQVSKRKKAIVIELLIQNYQQLAAHDKVDDILHRKIDIDLAFKKADLTNEERRVVQVTSLGLTAAESTALLNMSPWKYQKLFNRACWKMARVLGGDYLRGRV